MYYEKKKRMCGKKKKKKKKKVHREVTTDNLNATCPRGKLKNWAGQLAKSNKPTECTHKICPSDNCQLKNT
jgi:hypothetical protein